MKSENYSSRISKFVLSFFFLNLFVISLAQTAPEITRLIQQNTLKGSRISIVETTDNFTYHIGTINSSEVGFDNLSAASVGVDDLFVLKSNAGNGTNSWFKTFNAGNKGTITPRYVYVDSSENLYIFAQFKGTVTVGNKTISSVNLTDAFLVKIDSNGNAVWINYLENAYNPAFKVKVTTDGNDIFFVYGGTHLVKLNNGNGQVIYDNNYSGIELKSVAIKDQDIYIGGTTLTPNTIFGTETLTEKNTGFILKGDKNANFTASLKTTSADSTITSSDISDIAISSDGYLLLSGFYGYRLINLVTEAGTVSFSYNPNTNYSSSGLFNFVAKVDFNLASVSFFRSSTYINQGASYSISISKSSSRLIAYGNTGNFRQIIRLNDKYSKISSYTNTNGYIVNFSPDSKRDDYTLITSSDSNGAYQSDLQPLYYGIEMSASGNYFVRVDNNIRVFTSGLYNFQNSNPLWAKQKPASVGGSYSKTFIKHLNSEKGDLFLTTLLEGKANFFGRQVDNGAGNYSRYFTRLGSDGLPKWIAKFDSASNIDKVNVSQNYAVVDKDDNFYVFCGKSTGLATFTDALGDSYSFTQNIGLYDKVLIKLDKNGKLIWIKQISGCDLSALTTDSNNNIYLTGISGDITIDGSLTVSNNNSLFILKFDQAGSLIYSKAYSSVIVDAFSMIPVIDAQDNFYIFSEPIKDNGLEYNFGNINFFSNEYNTDLIMLKFDNNGNAVFGKNFYANTSNYYYAWPNDVQFDGENFVMMGNLLAEANNSYVGLDLTSIPQVYTNNYYPPFIAKINTSGNVVWQKLIDSNSLNPGNYTNINIDENKNIYMFYYVRDKVSINGTEFSFNNTKGNKVLLKMNTNGNLSYFKTIDLSIPTFYPMIDVFGNDKVNLTSFTSENNILTYPIDNANASNLYVATVGDLDQKYLTPKSNYLLLTKTSISNNQGNANQFEFDLINNVNWNATSDQSWLNLSFTKLTEGKNVSNSISGNGDAKIVLTAETNNSGADRSANVLLTGDNGVASKTLVVTQTGILETGESRTYITIIYPNPTSDVLNIKTEQKMSKVEIYDSSGKLLKTVSRNLNVINVSGLVRGLYFIKIYNDQNVINSKFVKN